MTGAANTRSRRGLTLVELSLGLVLLSLIGAALGSVMLSASNAWSFQQESQDAMAGDRQASHQVYQLLRKAKRIGLATKDDQTVDPVLIDGAPSIVRSASGVGGHMMIWREDANGDGIMQASEISLVAHNTTDSTLQLFEMPQSSVVAAVQFAECDIADSLDAETFKLLSGVTSRVLARNVRTTQFAVVSTGNDKQSVEYVLGTGSAHRQRTSYGTGTLRAAKKPKSVVSALIEDTVTKTNESDSSSK